MKSILENNIAIPGTVNYVQRGRGRPVILIHGLAASLHDWDDLIPELADNGYACYALDLLGHGDSPKPAVRAYQADWLFEHFSNWITSLSLTEPPILIGHSLGGYLALEYARRVPAWTRGLVLVNPFYSRSQLPRLLRSAYHHTNPSRLAAYQMPGWLVRFFVDVSSIAMGHRVGALHSLPERIRFQTALDYKRTAAGVYHIPGVLPNVAEYLHEIEAPTLVVWGDRDQSLAPASFPRVVEALPHARGEVLHAGHVPHQSHAAAFNQIALKFLKEIW